MVSRLMDKYDYGLSLSLSLSLSSPLLSFPRVQMILKEL